MNRRWGTAFLFILLSVVVVSGLGGNVEARVDAGTTTRVSVASDGAQANNSSEYLAISADGRFVAFPSRASNLVPGDTNYAEDVFVHDRQTGQTTRVSVDSGGTQGNGGSGEPTISADGRFVAFGSRASNLVAGDTNYWGDVFVHDRQTGQTTRVSVDSGGTQRNGEARFPAISANGRFVAFESEASNLVAGDTNGKWDVFVHDRQTGQTTRVSVSSGGAQANDWSQNPAISADGRFVAFRSEADNLVAGDTNGTWDIFVHDRQTGQTTRVSVNSNGAQANNWSWVPAISANGRHVAFDSSASNLVASDTNGTWDAFVHDRQTGQTTRVSVDSGGAQANDHSVRSVISAGGRFVAFSSLATNLVAGDTNGRVDAFVHDRQTGQTTRISVDSGGTQGNGDSWVHAISADVRFVAFTSEADNLVPGDTNGKVDVFVHDRLVGSTPIDVAPISIGFKLYEDGYGFANFQGVAPIDYPQSDMVKMFGAEATCANIWGSVCQLKPAAVKWHLKAAMSMLGGVCFGMTTTALRFFTNIDDPSSFEPGETKVFWLEQDNARRNIGWNFVLQFTPPIRQGDAMFPPNEVLERVYQSLQSKGLQLNNLIIASKDLKSGHSVLPYAIEDAGNGKWRIKVYDNNSPNDTNRYILIDTLANSFSTNLVGPPGSWTGGATNGNIGIVPLSVLVQQPKCPWCGGTQLRDGVSTATVMSQGVEDLLITDDDGDRVGYVDGELINEIADAVVMPIFGGLGIEQEPIYYLPATSEYTIAVSGDDTRTTADNDITVFGPGFMAVAGNMLLDGASQDRMIVSANGQQVAYKSSQAKQVDLWLTGGSNENEQYKIVSADVGSGEEISLRRNNNNQIVVSHKSAGGGTYTLELTRITGGTEELFIHRDISIMAGDSHVVDLGSLTGESVEICVDTGSNGSIDDCQPLENEVASHQTFLPVILWK